MSAPLLLKGFEVEMYTGRADGTVVGCSDEVAAAMADFVTEPDHRNLEYVTPPVAAYTAQLERLLEPRRRLRRWLRPRGLTLLPGSTLSLGDSSRFERSDPDNPYHSYIETTYGTRVVTASVHINLGLTAMEALFAGLRLLRCEAALLLALSASSPFLDGVATGAHSQRWLQFPLTPPQVPLFLDHAHYIRWMEEQLAAGAMRNVRHLWTSVRPNGDDRPHDLNRLEIRICDLIDDPLVLLAVTAFAELRLQQLLQDPAGPGSAPCQPAGSRGDGGARRCQRPGRGPLQPRGPPASLARPDRPWRPATGSPPSWRGWPPWRRSWAWSDGWHRCTALLHQGNQAMRLAAPASERRDRSVRSSAAKAVDLATQEHAAGRHGWRQTRARLLG